MEQAADGVLFLDEIGDLPLNIQPKLLRLLDGHPVQPLGDERWVTLRARVVAASHIDLEEAVAQGVFRHDLYFRLAVHVIRVPPLRERLEDVPELVRVMLERGRRTVEIEDDALAALAQRSWPGNVRQLAAVLTRLAAAAAARGTAITAEDVVEATRTRSHSSLPAAAHARLPERGFQSAIDEYGVALVDAAMRQASGNVSEAARLLKVDRMVLVRQLGKRRRTLARDDP